VEAEDVKNEVMEILNTTLADNVKARVMQSDGTYKRTDRRGKESVHSQMLFYDMAVNKNKAEEQRERDIFIPMMSPYEE
jgi:polyphosphate kinase